MLRRYRTPAPDGVGSFMEILNGVFGSGLASAGGQTNPLVLSLSKDEPWDARGSTGSPRAWEPISARSKLEHCGVFARRTCDGFCDTVRRFSAVPAAFLFEETP
jgi:hypothetical protein